MGFGRLEWRRKLTAIIAVIALGLVALCAPRFTGGERDPLQVRPVGLAAKAVAVGKQVWTGVLGILPPAGRAGWIGPFGADGAVGMGRRGGAGARGGSARAPPGLRLPVQLLACAAFPFLRVWGRAGRRYLGYRPDGEAGADGGSGAALLLFRTSTGIREENQRDGEGGGC